MQAHSQWTACLVQETQAQHLVVPFRALLTWRCSRTHGLPSARLHSLRSADNGVLGSPCWLGTGCASISNSYTTARGSGVACPY